MLDSSSWTTLALSTCSDGQSSSQAGEEPGPGGCLPCGSTPTFAQVVGAHEAGLGGPGPDPLPGLVLRAPEPAEQDVPFALVFKSLAVGVVPRLGACGHRDSDSVDRQ